MRPISRIFLGAVLCASFASVSAAESPMGELSLDPALAEITDMPLDLAFERSTAPNDEDLFANLGGPTTMDCDQAELATSPETCVVTARRRALAQMPASLAQH